MNPRHTLFLEIKSLRNMKQFTLALLCAFCMVANAQDIVVNGSGLPGTYNTISAAVDAANPGDKILVSNQAFPYQEDTLFIDKSVTIMPYNDINPIGFEGDIQVTLDSISELTLIGFDSEETDVWSVFNDTTRNSLTTVNVVDCKFERLEFDQTKTSLYLSYSTVDYVYFSHGDIIGNKIRHRLDFGVQDWEGVNANGTYLHPYENRLNTSNYPSACNLMESAVEFGSVETFSDTCNIIANDFLNGGSYKADVVLHSQEFAFNVRNNLFSQGPYYKTIAVYLACPSWKGVNQVINNNLSPASSPYSTYEGMHRYGVTLMLAQCSSSSPTHNFENVVINVLNNSCFYPVLVEQPPGGGYGSDYFDGSSVCAYNSSSSVNASGYVDGSDMFQIGPNNSDGSNPNPSDAFLNLDLTTNTRGVNGGSDAWSNYHSGSEAGFGTLTGSKARITYLNLPTQIFDPSNITIKARAVHGN